MNDDSTNKTRFEGPAAANVRASRRGVALLADKNCSNAGLRNVRRRYLQVWTESKFRRNSGGVDLA